MSKFIDLKSVVARDAANSNSNVASVKLAGDKIVLTMKRVERQYENKKGGHGLCLTEAGSHFSAEGIDLILEDGTKIPAKLNVFLSIPIKG